MKILRNIREFFFGKVLRLDNWIDYKLKTDEHFAQSLINSYNWKKLDEMKSKMGYCASNAILGMPDTFCEPHKIYMYENTSIYENAKFIISEKGETGRFIMKKNSCAAQGLTIITGTHGRIIGEWFNDVADKRTLDVDKDIVVEEDVWLGANVTLLSGVTVGRGSTVGANSLVRTNIPPYAIVTGNPAKVVGFSFKPEEVIEHEKALFPEVERLPLDKLEKNYKRYFLNRLVEIRNFTSL